MSGKVAMVTHFDESRISAVVADYSGKEIERRTVEWHEPVIPLPDHEVAKRKFADFGTAWAELSWKLVGNAGEYFWRRVVLLYPEPAPDWARKP